jgi:hypothetical protein
MLQSMMQASNLATVHCSAPNSMKNNLSGSPRIPIQSKNNTSIRTMMETLDQQCNHKKLSPKKSIKNISFSRMMQSFKIYHQSNNWKMFS